MPWRGTAGARAERHRRGRGVSRHPDGLRRVEREIIGEKAAALGRAGERLEAALAALETVRQAVEQIRDETRLAELRSV